MSDSPGSAGAPPQDLVGLLFRDYRDGRFAEAAARAAQMLSAQPGDLRLHSLLAACRAELGDYEGAVESYRAALRIRPEFAKLHNGLGVAYLRLARFEEAFRSFQAAIRHDPRLAEAHFNAGILLENAERWTEALAYHRCAAAVAPGYLEALTAAGRVLRRLERIDEAVESFEAALAIRHDHEPALGGLLEALERSNRYRHLDERLARARAVLGDHPLVRVYEGILANAQGDPAGARLLLESVSIESGGEDGLYHERRRLAHLVRVCDVLDDPGAALLYADSANDISRRLCEDGGIRKETFLRFVARRRHLIDRPQRNAGSLDDVVTGPGEAPLFLVGFPRSGTTLLDTLLRGHPRLTVVEESGAVGRMVTALAGPADERLAALDALSESALARGRQIYVETLGRPLPAPSEGRVVVDRFALNIVYAAEIHRVFPKARFLLMLRHPVDCVLSCFLQSFEASSANASFFTMADAAHLYDRVFDLWERQSRTLALDALTVRYEDLVDDPGGVCRRLLDDLGVPWHPGVVDHRTTARRRPLISTASYDQVIRPIHGDARNRWRRYADALEPVMPLLQRWIERFGYAG